MAIIPFDQRDGWIWFNGEFVPWKEAKVHVLTHGLHYGSSVFEGERAYGGEIFKSTEHSDPLHESAEIMDFEIPYSVEELNAAKDKVVRAQWRRRPVCPPRRLARLGDDGGLRPEQQDPRRHRHLGLALDVRPRDQDEGHQARHRRITAGPTRHARPSMPRPPAST